MHSSIALVMAALLRMGTSAAEPESLFTVSLRPAGPNWNGVVPEIEVVETFQGMHPAAGQPLTRMARVWDNVESAADHLQNLQAFDEQGALTLGVNDYADAGGIKWRHWTATRAVIGALTIRYSVPITNALNPRGAAPPLELRTEGGGFSGAAGGFLMLPDNAVPIRLAVRWDLSAFGQGAIGVSNAGPGDLEAGTPEGVEELLGTFFMGGTVQHYPDKPSASGFFSAWQGSPPFDAPALMGWTEALYGHYLGYFHAPPAPFTVFLRRNLINPGGGVELGDAFVGTFDREADTTEFKSTLSHEMVHSFVRGLNEPDELAASWYSEGLAVYYQRALPLRAGLISVDDFLADLNSTAGRYFTDPLNETPNSEIPGRFWADTRVRVLPYDRGAMYFARVDREVRIASGGKRSLDDLVLAMIQRRRAGASLHQADWVDLVTRELGPRGRSEFEDMLAGRLMVPESDAFGPCFVRTIRPLRRFELGFEPAVLTEPTRIVRDLAPTSAAARAGLRNGDQITRPVPQDRIQADQRATITLQVLRDGKAFSITYLPRGETISAYQWAKRSIAGKGHCAL